LLSLAGAFAVATAENQKSKLVVGNDREFEGLTLKLLKIREWPREFFTGNKVLGPTPGDNLRNFPPTILRITRLFNFKVTFV